MLKMLASIMLMATVAIGSGAKPASADPVKVEGGYISGTAAWGAGVRMYRGVPFAAPPVGDLRWRAPQPLKPWTGVRAADKFAPACMQQRHPLYAIPWNTGVNGYSEDCLYLNIWTPSSSQGAHLPVMVWFPGGGGREGSGAEPLYEPSLLAKRGVVVVTVNYRVNLFGWMATPALTAESGKGSSGNYGALDQIAALQWVKRNIAGFGGDPDAVTIFGESGGSRSVNWLMATPLARGLFRGAIGESHTIFDTVTTLRDAEATGVAFQRRLGANSLAALRALPADELLTAYLDHPSGMNAPNVDGYFLPDQVRTIFEQGRQNDVALITGGNEEEQGDSHRQQGAPSTLAEYQGWVRATFGDQSGRLLAIYPARTDAEVPKAYQVFQRDANLAGHWTWVRLQASTGKKPAWLYDFAFGLPSYGPDGHSLAGRHAVHTGELAYVFDNLRSEDRPWSAADQEMAYMMASYWTNFARTLDPNGLGLPRWPSFDPGHPRLLFIADETQAQRVQNIPGLLIQDEHNRRATHLTWTPPR